ncbi:MAG: polymer-forming cytoskeletal protein [Acidobacteriota bacterium]|nr:polymer-forming cytoskeletal protein [Acidobacteriota bacterium]
MTDVFRQEIDFPQFAFGRHIFGIFIILVFLAVSIFAQTDISQPDENTLIINDAPEMKVFAFGKTVIVENRAKGVLSFGGNVIIKGKVDGDVATIGGSVTQEEKAFIGGDVIILGGKYQPEAKNPLRQDGKETIMYAGYEEELRNFAPDLSLNFLVQRILSLLFWFLVALGLTTITPNAVSRSVVRFRLSTLKIFGIGALAFTVTTLGVIVSFGFLPGFISAVVGLMAFVLIMLAYVFGRVALQVSVGNWFLKQISPDKKRSETISLFIGAFIWTLLLSIPYVWTAAVFILFTASLGLVLTARPKKNWEQI